MSQRKQVYTVEEMVNELVTMDQQIIHGSDFFAQCADKLDTFEKALKLISHGIGSDHAKQKALEALNG